MDTEHEVALRNILAMLRLNHAKAALEEYKTKKTRTSHADTFQNPQIIAADPRRSGISEPTNVGSNPPLLPSSGTTLPRVGQEKNPQYDDSVPTSLFSTSDDQVQPPPDNSESADVGGSLHIVGDQSCGTEPSFNRSTAPVDIYDHILTNLEQHGSNILDSSQSIWRTIAEESAIRTRDPQSPDNTTDSDGMDALLDHISDRMGSLQIGSDGQIRYYGPTSHFNLLRMPPPDNLTVHRTVRNDGQEILSRLELAKEVPAEFEEHLTNFYFAWHNPTLYVVDREMYEAAKRRWRSHTEETPYYSEALANAM